MIHFTIFGVPIFIWPSEVFGLMIVVTLVVFFWRAQDDDKNPIDLAKMFFYPDSKQMSMAMVIAFIGTLTGVWVVVDAELKGRLTSESFLGFLALVIGGKGMTEWVSAWRNKAPAQPPPAAQQQFVGTADTVTAPAAPIAPAPVVVPAPPVKLRKRHVRAK